jgi:hypothetical protein
MEGFNSFNEARQYFFDGKDYFKRENNIKCVEFITILQTKDIGICQRKGEDGQITIALIFKPSLHYDKWIYWVMSENQVDVMAKITPHVLDYMNNYTDSLKSGGKVFKRLVEGC